MDGWIIGLIILLVAGIGVIAYGALSDRRKHRRQVTELLSPPPRPIPQLDPQTPDPNYLPRAQAHRPPDDGPRPPLADDQRQTIRQLIKESGTYTVDVGYASPAFVTDPPTGWSVLEHPRVLVSAEPIMTVRELISVLEHMITDRSPLAIVAPALAPEVLDLLEVNHIQRVLDLNALLTVDPVIVDKIIASTGARLIGRVDLQTGYLADRDLGHCRQWISDQRRTHIIVSVAGDETAVDEYPPGTPAVGGDQS